MQGTAISARSVSPPPPPPRTHPGRSAHISDAGRPQGRIGDTGGDRAAGVTRGLTRRTLELVVAEGTAEEAEPRGPGGRRRSQ